MAISENFAYLLDPGIRKIFVDQYAALQGTSKIPLLFNVQSSNKAKEYDLGIGGMGDFNEYKGAINYDDVSQLWRTTYEPTEYVKGFKVERKLVDDDLYNIINKRPMEFAIAAFRTREKHAASVFNNAMSGSYPGADAVALCASTHDYAPDDGTHQSNLGSAALSYANLVAAREAMRAFKDDRGNLINVQPDLLLVPAELEGTANEILNTMRGGNSQQPTTANYLANLAQDRGITYVVWDYLTDSNRWFLLDTQLSRLYLNWFDRVPIEIALDPSGGFDLEARWRAYVRYSYGFSDYRWVYGSEDS